MSPPSYHGGHALADILCGWRLWLPQAQECLARLLSSGDITIEPPCRDGWWLERDDRGFWVVNVDGREPAEAFRCRFSDPQLLDFNYLSAFVNGLAPPEPAPPIPVGDPESPRIKRLEALSAQYEAEEKAEAAARAEAEVKVEAEASPSSWPPEPPEGNADLPSGQPEPEIATAESSVKALTVAAAVKMRADDEIPANISRNDFAKTLAHRIESSSSHDYVRKNLKEWGLWPIAEIKIEPKLPKDLP
jgi:hypothetical protein